MKSQRVKEHNCPADKRNVVEPAGEWSEEDVLGQLSGPDSLVLLDRWKSDGSVRMLAAAALDSAVNSGSRWFATRYLGEFTDEEAVGALERLLSDDEMRLREQAARSLGEVGPDARPALPALVRALFDGEGPVRVAAARTLGRIGDESVVPDLLKAADTTPWDTLHGWVTDSLVRLHAPQASDHLVRRLESEKPWQRRWAASKLGEVGRTEALGPLVQARSRDPLHRRTYTRAMR